MAETLTNEELLERIDDLPWGPRLHDEAVSVVALAEERGDVDLEFGARMRLTANGVMTGVSDVALTNFAWCAAKHKEDPARFYGDEDSESDQIFWHYKWMPGLVSRSPAFDRAQVEAVLDDFEQTYRAAGLPLSAVVTARFETAMNLGDLAEAERWGGQLETLPTDAYSSCEACVPSDFVDLELLRGDEAAAVARALASWDEGNVCAEEPETMLASMLLPLLRQGKVKKARKAYTYVYGQTHSDPDKVINASYCALFASVTGNHELALNHVERHLLWLVHDALSESDHLEAATNFAVTLDRLIAARGAGDVLIRGSADPALAAVLPPVAEPRTAAELAAALWVLADDLAARFDARNGNDHYVAGARAARAIVTEEHPLELDAPAAFSPFTVRAARPSTGAEWLAHAIDAWWAMDAEATHDAATRALAADGLAPIERMRAALLAVAAAERLSQTQQPQGAGQAGAAGFDAAQAAYIDEAERYYGSDTLALARLAMPGTSADALAAAVDAAPDAAPLVQVRALMLALQAQLGKAGGPEQADFALAVQWAERASSLLAAEQFVSASDLERSDAVLSRTSVLVSLAQLRIAVEDVEGGFAAIDGAYAEAPSRAAKAAVLHVRGTMLANTDDPTGAATALDESASLYAASGWERAALLRALDAATLWERAGNAAAAVARYEYALGLVPPDEQVPASVRWNFAGALLAVEEGDRAVSLMEAILAEELAAGDVPPNSLAHTYYRLGRAYDVAYDDRAAANYRQAAELFAAAGEHRPAAQAALAAGREHWYQDEADEGFAALDFAAAQESLDPAPDLAFDITLLQAQVLRFKDDPEWVAHADRAVEIARAENDSARIVSALEARMSLHRAAGNEREAVALAPEVIGAALGAGDGDTAVNGLWALTQAHIALGDPDAAAGMLTTFRVHADDFGDSRGDLAEMGAEVLRSIDRPDEATRWLAALAE